MLHIVFGIVAAFLLSLTPVGRSARRWLMAKGYGLAQRRYDRHIGERKRQLFTGVAGTVLELGPGTGANFDYLPDSVDHWIGIEPNIHMFPQLREAGARRGISTEFRNVAADSMGVADGSVDAVISTLVLCSVPSPEQVVDDILRVLKPGGTFVFIEHVAAPEGTRLRRWQGWVKPLWRYLADGCCPDRELAGTIQRGGFARVELEPFVVPRGVLPVLVSPQISGVAVK